MIGSEGGRKGMAGKERGRCVHVCVCVWGGGGGGGDNESKDVN